MSETKFTPGPWTLTEGYKQKVFAQSDAMTVCDIRGWGYLTGLGGLHLPVDKAVAIQDANAHLIAAAPELYEALESARIALTHDVPGSCWATGPLTGDPIEDLIVCPGCRAMHKIEAALKKVRGEQ